MKPVLILPDGFIIYDKRGNYYAEHTAQEIKDGKEHGSHDPELMTPKEIKLLIKNFIENGNICR